MTGVPSPSIDPSISHPRTSLIGREPELELIRRLLVGDGARLVTLTGPGGIGKTRLALAAAQSLASCFADGVVLVDLSAIFDPGLVLPMIAQSVRAHGLEEPVLHRLRMELQAKDLLLILDNLEQVVQAAPELGTLLGACPRLRMLTTSRVLLRLAGEQVLNVPPLPLPAASSTANPEHLAETEAVRLFVERAKAVRSDFALTAGNAGAVAEICRQLDGLPLAIELAAARSNILAPAVLRERLSDPLRLLIAGTHDAPERHRALRQTIAWSHELLSPEEKVVFRRLAVFTGGFTLAAAEVVIDPDQSDLLDILSSLADKSMLQLSADPLDSERLTMLETVREYAREQLDASGETAKSEHARLAWAGEFVERIERDLTGPEQRAGLDSLAAEHANLRASLEYAVTSGRTNDGVRLATGLALFWELRGFAGEGRSWLDRLLALPDAEPEMRGKALTASGRLAIIMGDASTALARLTDALAIWRQQGNRLFEATVLDHLGHAHAHRGHIAEAIECHEQAIAVARELDLSRLTSRTLAGLGAALHAGGQLGRASTCYEEALAIARSRGDAAAEATLLNNLGLVAAQLGDFARARALMEKQLAIAGTLGDKRGEAIALGNLVQVLYSLGDHLEAQRCGDEALARFQAVGDQRGVTVSRQALGNLAASRGDHHQALLYFYDALALAEQYGNLRDKGIALWNLAESKLALGDLDAAIVLLTDCLTCYEELGDGREAAEVRARLGETALERGDMAEAMTAISAALTFLVNEDLSDVTTSALVLAARIADTHHRPRKAVRLIGASTALAGASASIREQTSDFAASLRERLGIAGYAQAWEAGTSFSLGEAVADALTANGLPEAPAAAMEERSLHGLTPREIEVLRLIADGRPDREIAQELFVSPRTVNGHVTNVLNKLGVDSRAAAAVFAVRNGIL